MGYYWGLPGAHWRWCSIVLVAALACNAEPAEALPGTQVQGLLKLQALLDRPSATANWNNKTDFCNLPSSSHLGITCSSDTLTYLRIVGDKSAATLKEKLEQGSPNGWLGPTKSLSSYFSVNTLVDTLLTFPDLQGVELVNLGMWGTLPDKLGQMQNLQVLNASSNLFTGAIPRGLHNFTGLKTLALDNNALAGPFPYWLSAVPTIETLSLSYNFLTGELNDSVSYFWNLKSLSLNNNLLSGIIGRSVGSLQNLQSLSLAHNQFTGLIPILDNLSNLRTLNVGGNSLGPTFPILSTQLVTVYVAQNELSGPIPSFLKDFVTLQTLDVSGNALDGTPPPFLFNLPSISTLNLARNHFSGVLPFNLSLSKSLSSLDVSGNFLAGQPPLVFLTTKNATVNYQTNCLDTGKQKQGSEEYCTVTAAKLGVRKLSHNPLVPIIAVAAAGGLGLAVALCAIVFLLANRCGSDKDSVAAPEDGNLGSFRGIPSELLFNARYLSQSKRLGVLSYPQNKVFGIEELKAATNNFSPGALVGEGRHSKVFKGQLEDKTQVAIKWLNFKSKEDMSEYKTQLDILSKLRHRHLVSILGYCTDEVTNKVGNDEEIKSFRLFIVSEFVENGDLRSHLKKHKGKEPMNWSQRLAAVIAAGRGIHYLHTGVVAGETKAAGGPRLVHEGSLRRREHRDKQDVYDYGAILLEIVLGRPPTIRNPFPQKRSELERLTKEKGPSMELIDKHIVGTCGAESLATVLEIAGKCMVDDPTNRPSMEDVLWNLQYALQVHNSINDIADENDMRREEFQKAPCASEKKRGFYDNRVSDEDWKAGPSASRDFLR